MKPYSINSEQLTRTFLLNDPGNAMHEFTKLCQDYIVLVIYNSPNISDAEAREADLEAKTVVTNKKGLPEKRVLIIKDSKVLDKVRAKITSMLQNFSTDKTKSYENAVAFSVIKGTERVAYVILKGELGALDMNIAFDDAITQYSKIIGNNQPPTA